MVAHEGLDKGKCLAATLYDLGVQIWTQVDFLEENVTLCSGWEHPVPRREDVEDFV